MKNLYLLPIMLVCLLVSPKTFAIHIAGGDITYEAIGQDSFMVYLTIFEDCNGTPSPIGTLSITSMGSTPSYSASAPLTLSSTTDVTPICPLGENRCQNPSSTFQYGFQKKVYTALVILPSSGCWYRFSWSQCCRSPHITTGATGNFYLTSTIDKCAIPQNSSPKFSNDPVLLTCVGNCVTSSNSATDPDNDSLVYSLTHPLQDLNSPVNYTAPYAYNRPLNFNGFPNHNLPFNPPLCRGFHIDPSDGNLMFRPMQQQSTTMAIKVEEYRNGTKIGEIMREMQLNVLNCPTNTTPTLSGINGTTSFQLEICAGVETCFTIATNDDDFSDSTWLSFNSMLPGATYTIHSGQNESATICWTPDSSHASTIPYYFTAKVTDNHCPVVGVSTRAYRILVKEELNSEITFTDQNCGIFNFAATSSHSTSSFLWMIDSVSVSSDANFTHKFSDTGYYEITLVNFTNTCTTITDTIVHVTGFDPMNISYNITEACAGELVVLVPTVTGGAGSKTFLWLNDSSTNNTFTFTNSTSIDVIVEVIDANGCKIVDTLNFIRNPLPQIIFTLPTTACELGNAFNLENYAHPNGGNWAGIGITNNYFDPQVAGRGNHQLQYTFTDSLSCTSTAFTQILVDSMIKHPQPLDTNLCINSGAFNFSTAFANSTISGYNISGSGNNFSFNPDSVGVFTMYLDATDQNNCPVRDTFIFQVHGLPSGSVSANAAICPGDSIQLIATGGTSYSWAPAGSLSRATIPAPFASPDTNTTYTVTITDANQCSINLTVNVDLKPIPLLTLSNDTTICRTDTINLTVSGAAQYNWSPINWLSNATSSNPLAFPLFTTHYTVTGTGTNGCKATETVVITVDGTCVWPGDANYDGIVNNFDVLAIGLAFGHSGPPRTNASLNWEPQMADDWNYTFMSGVNYKQADTDGDGTVGFADTIAISLNYQRTHNKKETSGSGSLHEPPLAVNPNNTNYYIKDTLQLQISYGSVAIPAEDVYGLAFTLNFDPTLLNDTFYNIDLSSSWLGPKDSMVYLVKHFPLEGKVDVAIARIDQVPRTGMGNVARLDLIITDNINGKKEVTVGLDLYLTNIRIINHLGDDLTYNLLNNKVWVTGPVSVYNPDLERLVNVYPNPANNLVRINTTGIKLNTLRLTDVTGRVLLTEIPVNENNTFINISAFAPGMYFLHIETSEGKTIRKLIIK